MMKKKILSIVLALGLMLTTMTSTVWAADPPEIEVAGTSVIDGGCWINDGSGGIKTDGANETNYNVKYDKDKNELTLNNANITKFSNNAGIFSKGIDTTIILEGKSVITIRDTAGVSVEENLVMQGKGSLISEADGFGIVVMNNITLKEATVTGIANVRYQSMGVLSHQGNITIENGSLTGISIGASYLSFGVCAVNTSVVNGSITGISSENGQNSPGIFADQSFNIDKNSIAIGQGPRAIRATSYNFGDASAWYGTDQQTAFSTGPKDVPIDFTGIKYLVIGTPYILTTDDGISVSTTALDNKYPTNMILDIEAPSTSEGKDFEKWESTGGGIFGSLTSRTTTFTMPSANTTLSAIYKTVEAGGSDEPKDPGTSTNPGTSTSPTSDKKESKSSTAPQTSDSSNIGIYILTMGLAGIAGSVLVRKKKEV